MLISFAVKNFRSIKDRKEISMLKTGLSGFAGNYVKLTKKQSVLKSAVIYGSNASGKSNYLKAIHAMEYLVIHSSSYKLDERIEPYEPYLLDSTYAESPVEMDISFLYDSLQYDYSISFTSKRIEREELFCYSTKSKSLLFSRTAEKDMKFGDYYKGVKKTIEKLLLPNQLFLSKASDNNIDVLKSAYLFFRDGLSAFPLMEEFMESSMSMLYAKRLADDTSSSFARRFNALICSLDTGISSVTAKERDWQDDALGNLPEVVKNKIKEDYKYEIRTHHPVYKNGVQVSVRAFEIASESTGTQSLFAIGGILLDALDKGRVLVVDEFEKNLHPEITKYFIRMFHNPDINQKNAQLIFATHDISQLSNDHFRRDQVWFTNKDEYGSTDIRRCSDISGLRLGTPIDKWYASGRIGSTPQIDDRNFIIEMQKGVENED
ncbi:AAA family ATPase [Runella aurantiaca]|uniref:ATP-binding protein n=1 Tax=Runella aurantiaca TaxID=2282308 RepID=A0A369IKB6_9BACT|nr:ATP-binding protein [Runella aurantiaca]RDB07813.1 ATP-binding protein [Runella aurantiaca]